MSQKAKSHALNALDASIEERRKILKKAKKRELKGRPQGKQGCDLWVNAAPVGSLAHGQTKRAAAEITIDILLTHHAQTKRKGIRHFLATFAWDEGMIPSETGQLPDVKALQHKVYKALTEFGLSGLIVMELAAFDPTDAPAYLHAHFHAICWTYDPLFKPCVAADALGKRRAFRNTTFRAVDIRSRKMAANRFPDQGSHQYHYLFADLEKDQTKPSMAWLGRYPWKAPTSIKTMKRSDAVERDQIIDVPRSRNASKLHVQLELLMRQIPVLDVVSGVKEGSVLSRAWKSQMRASAKARAKVASGDARRRPKLGARKKKKRAKGRRSRSP